MKLTDSQYKLFELGHFYFACITKTSQKTLWKKIKSEVFKFVLSD